MTAFFQSWIGRIQSRSTRRIANAGHAISARRSRGASSLRAATAVRPGPTSQVPRTISRPSATALHAEAARLSVVISHMFATAGFTESGRDHLVDDVAAGDRPDREQEDAGDHDPDADRPHLAASASPHEPHGGHPADEDERPDPVGDRPQPLRDVLCGLELVGFEERDLARVFRDPAFEVLHDLEALAELDHERADVEHDVPVGRVEHFRLVLEHLYELLLRGRGQADEERLNPRAIEELPCAAVGGFAGDSRGWSDSLEVLRGAGPGAAPRCRRSRTASRPSSPRSGCGSRRPRSAPRRCCGSCLRRAPRA